MKFTKVFLLLALVVSCTPKDNIFYDAKKGVGEIVGGIIPATIAPEVKIDSHVDSELVGKNINFTGLCSNSDKVTLKSDVLAADVVVDCISDKFSTDLMFINTVDVVSEIEAIVTNKEKSSSDKLTLDIRIEKPTLSAHINIVESLTNSIEVSWLSSSSSSLPFVGYILEYKKSQDSNWEKSALLSSTNKIIENLDADTSYDFRVKAFNGNYSDYSQVSSTTKSLDSFFNSNLVNSINIAGATKSSLVAIQKGDFYLNGNLLVSLNAGETHKFNSAKGDVLSSSAAYFIAGKIANTTSSSVGHNANVVWTQEDWASKKFLLNQYRFTTHKLVLYPFESGTISIKKGSNIVATENLTAKNFKNITISGNSAYSIDSDVLVGIYVYSVGSSNYLVDPRPLLPVSTDQVGIPSSRGLVSSDTANSSIKYSTSNGFDGVLNLVNPVQNYVLSAQGSTNLYKSEAARLQATAPFYAASYADSTGYNSSPFVSRAKMKKTYAVNVNANWIAFSSVNAGSILVTQTNGTTSSIPLVKSGNGELAVYKARVENILEGTIFNASVPVAAWYEPSENDFSAKQDETIMFGFNL